jgi:hypothetical protein
MNEPTLRDIMTSLEGVHTRLDQHGVALHELSDEMHGIRSTLAAQSATLGAHSATLDRIERRQSVEARTLDDHERRITALESRP